LNFFVAGIKPKELKNKSLLGKEERMLVVQSYYDTTTVFYSYFFNIIF